MTPALTARKLGRIHRIRFVCPWSGFAVLADGDELVEGAVLCSPGLTEDGTGASGIAVAATSPCGVAAVSSKPAFCCAIAGVRANRKIARLITNCIKSPVLIKSTPLILRTGRPLLLYPRDRIPQIPTRVFDVACKLWFYIFFDSSIEKLDESPLWPSAIDSSTLEIVRARPQRVDFEVCKLQVSD